MRYRAALLIVFAACNSQTDLEGVPVKVTLIAPSVVTGAWNLIEASPVLNCSYDLTAIVSGGQADDAVEWEGATIWLDAPPDLLATQPYSAARVAEWFSAPSLDSGSSATAQLSIGRGAPFTAAHQLSYRPTRGAPSSAEVNVQCRAP